MAVVSNNSYFIFNKAYPKACISVYSRTVRCTEEKEVRPDQIWMFKPRPNCDDFFFIESIAMPRKKIAKCGPNSDVLELSSNHACDSQLWKIKPARSGHVFILNKKYEKCRLAKWGQGALRFGTSVGKFCENEEWKLVPRFTASLHEVTIWGCDNRQGTKDVVSGKLRVTEGVIVNDPKKFPVMTGFLRAASSAISSTNVRGIISIELRRCIQDIVFYESIEHWSHVETKEFTAPAGKKISVLQVRAAVESSVPENNFLVCSQYTISDE